MLMLIDAFFQGDMNREQRNAATKEIATNPETKYMISGLKCGGLGLNWTWANHVLIL
jgi:SNF2 family DNA or RNA helicase